MYNSKKKVSSQIFFPDMEDLDLSPYLHCKAKIIRRASRYKYYIYMMQKIRSIPAALPMLELKVDI